MKQALTALLAISIIVCTYSLFAQETTTLLDRQATIAQAQSLNLAAYPNAKAILVSAFQLINYRADGTFSAWHEEYLKILSEEARRDYSTLSSYFTIPYQRGPEDCQFKLIEIIKTNGTVVPIDIDKQSRIMVNPGSMGANIYNPNEKVIQVNIPGLENGDLLHYLTFDRVVQPPVPGVWYDHFFFESTYPIIQSVTEVHGPTNRPILCHVVKNAISNTITFSQNSADDQNVYRWQASNVPQYFPEPDMPAAHTVCQRVIVSTAPDWPSISRWYWKLCEPHLNCDQPMLTKINELTANATNDAERTEAIFRFVAQNIRYMGITTETNAPGMEPHDAKETFAARYGVCRDKATLLTALLRAAGIQAFPTLIFVGPKIDPEVPQPFFNHAITAISLANGSYELLDATDENSPTPFPSYLADKSYLIATTDGDPLRISPEIAATDNMLTINTTATIDPAGNLQGSSLLEFSGINDNLYRDWLARHTQEERQQLCESAVKKAAAGATLQSFTITPANIFDPATNLAIQINYSVPSALLQSQETTLLPLPSLGPTLGVANLTIKNASLLTRKYPFVTEVPCGIREHIRILLPTTYILAAPLPPPSTVSNNAVIWNFSLSQNGNILNVSSIFLIRHNEITPQDYSELMSTLWRRDQDLRTMPRLIPSQDGDQKQTEKSDALTLEETVTIKLTDPQNWTEERTIKKGILTYAGVRQNSEIKIDYNPIWENVELLNAETTSPDGQKRSIKPQEINIMDASWVGTASRYPAGKTLVASLPAVVPGSIVTYTFRRTCSDHPFFALYEPAQGLNPTKKKTISIDAPVLLPLKIQTSKADNIQSSDQPNPANTSRQTYSWVITNMPAIHREGELPPDWTFMPSIYVSAGNWQNYVPELAAYLTNLATNNQTNALAKVLQPLKTGDTATTVERVRNYVMQNIRPAGPDLTQMPLTYLTPPAKTLSDGYANDADRAILLYALLQAAGIKSDFVLRSDLPMDAAIAATLQAVPNYKPFTDILVAFRLAGSDGVIYLNDTDQYAALGATPSENLLGLELATGQVGIIQPAEPNGRAVRYAIKLIGSNAIVSVQQTYSGSGYGQEKKRLAEMNPEERNRYHEELLSEISTAAQPIGDLEHNFTNYPGIISYEALVPQYPLGSDEYRYCSLPNFLKSFFRLASSERRNPLYFNNNLNFEAQLNFNYASNEFTLATAPANLVITNFDEGTIAFSREQKQVTNNGIAIETKAKFRSGIIATNDYSQLLEINRLISHRAGETIILRRIPGPASNAASPSLKP